jgi:protocatechuate 3,4-dioxygenase beta subunit
MTLDSAYKPRDWHSHPPYITPDYKSTVLRGPTKPLVPLAQGLSELTGPVYGHETLGPLDNDLTKNGAKDGVPLGERIVVTGRVLDEDGRSLPDTLVEVWQANGAGRYNHPADTHDAPLDPNFLGGGRCVSDGQGRYSFHTIKPGAYPWPSG